MCSVFRLKVFPLPQNNYVKFVGFGRSSVILEVITGGCDITLGCLVMSSTTSGELIEMQDLAPLPDIVVSSSANSYKTSPEAPNTN